MSVAHPRGPLPKRVYWFRRLLVLAILAALVMVIMRFISGGSDGKDADAGANDQAAPVAGEQSPPVGDAGGDDAGAPVGTEGEPVTAPETTAPALEVPSGPCSPRDLEIVASVDNPRGGGDVPITLTLATKAEGACTFAVSSDSIALRITSGADRIWTTQQCPKAVPTTSVVLRKETPAQVQVTWNGRRSDDGCTTKTKWALPGYYHAAAAAFGSEPTDVQFELLTPPRPTVTADPEQKSKKKKSS